VITKGAVSWEYLYEEHVKDNLVRQEETTVVNKLGIYSPILGYL